MSIEIKPTGSATDHHTLHVNGFQVASLEVLPHGVFLNWSIYGPLHWPEAKEVLLGLLEFSLLADQLTVNPQHGKTARKENARQSRDAILGVTFTKAEDDEDDAAEKYPLVINISRSKRAATKRVGKR